MNMRTINADALIGALKIWKGEAVLKNLSDADGGWFFVFCVKGCAEQTLAHNTAEEAIEAWNSRAKMEVQE